MENLFAWTEPGSNYPAYVNINQDGDTVFVNVRGAPDVRNQTAGYTVQVKVPASQFTLTSTVGAPAPDFVQHAVNSLVDEFKMKANDVVNEVAKTARSHANARQSLMDQRDQYQEENTLLRRQLREAGAPAPAHTKFVAVNSAQDIDDVIADIMKPAKGDTP